MFEYIGIGILLGFSAGIAPGPLLMLVISETVQHGVRSGIKVAMAPIITDLPIILLTLFVLIKLSGYQSVLGLVSLAGGLLVLFTAYETLRIQPIELALPTEQTHSLMRGILTNLLSPHPYLFWISVGAPLLYKSLSTGLTAFCAFLGGFYLALVGSKILLAIGVEQSRQLLRGRFYLHTMRLLGILLALFAVALLRDGLLLLQVL